MRRAPSAVALLLLTSCAMDHADSVTRHVVSVVCPWDVIEAPLNEPSTGWSRFDPLDGLSVSVFCVRDSRDTQRLLMALRERGDDIIVGLGRPVLPAMLAVANRDSGTAFLWIGWDASPVHLPSNIGMWWVRPESLQVVIADSSIQDCDSDEIVLVGDFVSDRLLAQLKQSGITVDQRLPTVRLTRDEAKGVEEVPRTVLVLERPVRGVFRGSDRVYWAAEGPPEQDIDIRAELRMTWSKALEDVLNWHLGKGGIPPGLVSNRWLTLEYSESGVDSS